MSITTLTVSRATHKRLLKIQAQLQNQRGIRVTMDEAAKFLLDYYDEHKVNPSQD